MSNYDEVSEFLNESEGDSSYPSEYGFHKPQPISTQAASHEPLIARPDAYAMGYATELQPAEPQQQPNVFIPQVVAAAQQQQQQQQQQQPIQPLQSRVSEFPPLPSYQQATSDNDLGTNGSTTPPEADNPQTNTPKDNLNIEDQRFSFRNSFCNVLFMFFGSGIFFCFFYLMFAFFLTITVVGYPIVPAILRLAALCLFPFGSNLEVKTLTNEGNMRLTAGNVIWTFFVGWFFCLAHILIALGYLCTIIMIPFAFVHFKLAQRALAPLQATDSLYKLNLKQNQLLPV